MTTGKGGLGGGPPSASRPRRGAPWAAPSAPPDSSGSPGTCRSARWSSRWPGCRPCCPRSGPGRGHPTTSPTWSSWGWGSRSPTRRPPGGPPTGSTTGSGCRPGPSRSPRSGWSPGAAEPLRVNLAVSIHAADDATRDRLVPVNRSWPIAELLDAVGGYVAATRRRVSFEYALMAGVNDDLEQATRLGRLLAPLRVPGSGGHAAHVNLIPYNPPPGTGFSPPSRAAVRRFRDAVAASGVPVSVRANRGVGIAAACGQLRTVAGRPGRGLSGRGRGRLSAAGSPPGAEGPAGPAPAGRGH